MPLSHTPREGIVSSTSPQNNLGSFQVEAKTQEGSRNVAGLPELQSSPSAAHDAAGFPLFTHLPVELQTMVLKFACLNDNRVIKLYPHFWTSRKFRIVCSGYNPPAILHASPVTRRIALANRWYKTYDQHRELHSSWLARSRTA